MNKNEWIDADFWDEFDFSGGSIRQMETYLGEDMLMVEYPENLILDAGFYRKSFRIFIILNHNWQSPVAEYTCPNITDFRKKLRFAIERIRKEAQMIENFRNMGLEYKF